MKRLRLPFHLAVGVTIHCRSGQSIRFTASQINVSVNAFAKITGYSWQGGIGAPLFLDPEAIESIVTNRVIRWRGWFEEPATPPVVDAEAEAAVAIGPDPINFEGSDGGPLPEPRKVH